ncbi:Fe-S cluster assembly sulfur transfer protein SufU [Leuconostoc citreum]|uniref:Fe-S cluster assembly sulfur transfer protein SufU n=1 Tax=Leuconostoc citreum TaxID=33964 RepID=UPI0032DFD7D7
MTLHDLDQIYRQAVLDYAQHPHHKAPVTKADSCQIEQYNPTCWDIIRLALTVEHQTIVACHFDGEGCAISTASASIMMDLIIAQSLVTTKEQIKLFLRMVTGDDGDYKMLGDAQMLAGVTQFPARVKCATLPWHALSLLIKQIEGE